MSFFLLLVNLTARGSASAAAEGLIVDRIEPLAHLLVDVLQVAGYPNFSANIRNAPQLAD